MEPMPILPPPVQVERAPERPTASDTGLRSVENTPNVQGERQPGGASIPTVPSVPAPPPQPQPDPSSDAATSTTSASVANPTVADDVDVIEKEWVDRAKKVVNDTKNDPHLQEKEVSKIQADYLMKRYGKKMKITE